MSSCLSGRHTKSIPKSLPNISTGQFKHADEVLTEPDAGVPITILPLIFDISKFSLLAQSNEINERVEPVSIIAIKGVLCMKHVPLISLSSGVFPDPDKAK